jgi:aminocarboxymuconate-semialdehyde decarboxylase
LTQKARLEYSFTRKTKLKFGLPAWRRAMMKRFEARARVPTIGRRDFIKFGAGAGAMMALSTGPAPAQRETSRPVSIDLHTHWAPEPYVKALAELGRPSAITPNPLNFDLDKRLKWMDTHGVRTAVLTLNGGMPWQWVPPEVGAHIAQVVNDAAIETHTAFPDRFMAGIELSIRSPELSLKELDRVAGKPGLRAVHLPNSIEGDDYLFDPAYAPLLKRCEELGYPLLFHPLDGEPNYYGGKQRLGDQLALSARLSNTLGFPFETTTTAAKFIITGTLDKFPRLEIVLPHSGGAFPYVAGRVDDGLVASQFKLQRPFREYIRRFHYDTLTYYPETLQFLINLVGSDRVVIGTDNFATMDVEEPNALVERIQLPAADRDRILRGNAARLLRL